AHEASEVLAPEQCLPAVGQGCLAIEARKSDEELGARLRSLQDPVAAVVASVERAVLGAVEGDCRTPVAAYAEKVGDELRLRALLANPDGTRLRTQEAAIAFATEAASLASWAHELGLRLKNA